jgi:ferritin-like metal-binding protein YciE
MERRLPSSAHDAGLLAAAQAVEHYEMTRYGTLRTWAEELGYSKSVQLLQQILDEERATDKVLIQLAKALINLDAEKAEAAE